jgi:hypothetical protein
MDKVLSTFGSFLVGNSLLFTHSTDNGDKQFLVCFEVFGDLVAEFSFRSLHIVLNITALIHQAQETVVSDIDQLVFITANVGNIHVMSRGGNIFQLLSGENVNGDKVNLSMTVLASLGGGHFDDFARASLNYDVSIFPESGALHREGGGGPSVGPLEGLVMLLIIRHFERKEEELEGR